MIKRGHHIDLEQSPLHASPLLPTGTLQSLGDDLDCVAGWTFIQYVEEAGDHMFGCLHANPTPHIMQWIRFFTADGELPRPGMGVALVGNGQSQLATNLLPIRQAARHLAHPVLALFVDNSVPKRAARRYPRPEDPLIRAPTYQEQLETIYLSALDVSTERFRFEVQFFGGNVTEFFHTGKYRGIDPIGLDPITAANLRDRSQLRTDTDFRLEKQFATAGELLVGFALSRPA